MKIGRFLKENKETFGFIKDEKIATREQITYDTGVPLPFSVKEFLFDGWYDEVKGKLNEISFNLDLSQYKILAPISNPPKIICLAFNFLDHAKEQNLQPPDDPVIVIKPRTALTGTNSEIICPNFAKNIDYEIELAVIIGKTCKNLPEDQALNAIFGYTIMNDVSAREIQFKDKQFARAKGFDTFAPCGPWITTSDEVPDPQNLKMRTWVNGKIRQDSSSSQMALKISSIISKLSKVMTLEKGDIISTGTPAGVALNNPNVEFLKDGDKIQMEIEKIGTLENTVKFVDQ